MQKTRVYIYCILQDERSCEVRYRECNDISLKESYNKSAEKIKRVQADIVTAKPGAEPVSETKPVENSEEYEYEYYDEKQFIIQF